MAPLGVVVFSSIMGTAGLSIIVEVRLNACHVPSPQASGAAARAAAHVGRVAAQPLRAPWTVMMMPTRGAQGVTQLTGHHSGVDQAVAPVSIVVGACCARCVGAPSRRLKSAQCARAQPAGCGVRARARARAGSAVAVILFKGAMWLMCRSSKDSAVQVMMRAPRSSRG